MLQEDNFETNTRLGLSLFAECSTLMVMKACFFSYLLSSLMLLPLAQAEQVDKIVFDFGLAHREYSDSNQSPFEIEPSFDIPVLLTGLAVGFAPTYLSIDIDQDLRGLQPGQLNAIDRTVVGNASTNAQRGSDILLCASLALPMVLDFVDALSSDSLDGLGGFVTDGLILLEVSALNGILFNLAKFTIRRPRPYTYSAAPVAHDSLSNNASLSFFSGHTSLAFSMATSYSYIFQSRHPNSSWILPVWLTSHGIAAATAYLRVRAGKHFWTDVLAGSVVGSMVGFLVPYLHKRNLDRILPANHDLVVMPMFFEGGFGAGVWYLF